MTNNTLAKSQNGPGIQVNGSSGIGDNQPPRKRMLVVALIRIMLPYSPRKKSPKLIAEYSTKYPATSVASSSGMSKGGRLVSARADTKNTTNIGSSGITYQMWRCASTIAVRFKEPAQSSTVTSTKPIET